jgi:hypothetical protein
VPAPGGGGHTGDTRHTEGAETMAGLEQLGRSVTEVLVRVGGVAALVLTAWTAFKVLLAGGGAERALRQGIVTLLVAAIALAALGNPGATWGLFAALGGAIFTAVADAVRSAVAV